jgi:nucleoside-diphosphate-sugar epimerase
VFDMKSLLLGGGYCLSRLARILSPESCVVTSSTNEGTEALSDSGCTARRVDLLDVNSIRGLFEEFGGFQVVIDSVPPILSEGSYKQYLSGIEQFINCAKIGGVRRFIYLGTVGVFGKKDGRWVNEESSCSPLHARGDARLEVEQMYVDSGVDSYLLRLSGIYGPGRGLAKRIRSGVYPADVKREKWSNRIHVEDIVRLLERFCVEEGFNPASGIYCVVDDEPAMLGEVFDYYCKEFEIELRTGESNAPISEGKRARFALNQRVSNKKMKKELLSELLYPTYREGAKTTESMT